jgi:hypothetical protein
MLEIFFAICALTTLECNDIKVVWYQGFEEETFAAAGYDADNNYYVLINPDMENRSEKFKRQLMVHEIAHLLAFEVEREEISHFGIYEELCEDLKEKANVSGRTVCEPYHIVPHYPWRPLRRE